MTSRGPLRPALAHLHRPLRIQPPQRRTFLNSLLPSEKPLHINVTRTLPYSRQKLYDLIVDVDAYSSFLPYCQHSRVTAWSSAPDHNTRKWPTEGELTVGFGPLTQSYTSRIVCVPGRSVEALSGKEDPVAKKDRGENPFKRLVTKWTVEDATGEGTRVDLDLSMQLEDPLVQIMLGKVAEETAGKMIDAFETRARELFGDGR